MTFERSEDNMKVIKLSLFSYTLLMIFLNIVYLSLQQSPPFSRHPTTGTTPLPARYRGTEMHGDSQADVPGERDGHFSVFSARQRGYTCSSSPKVTNRTSSIEIGGKFNFENFVESLLYGFLLAKKIKTVLRNSLWIAQLNCFKIETVKDLWHIS